MMFEEIQLWKSQNNMVLLQNIELILLWKNCCMLYIIADNDYQIKINEIRKLMNWLDERHKLTLVTSKSRC